MGSNDQKTVHLKLRFADGRSAQPLFDQLRKDAGLAINVLRGRVTRSEARYDVEVRGSVRTVAALMRSSA